MRGVRPMKQFILIIITLVLLLAGCAPNFSRDDEIVQENDDSEKKSIVPNFQISDEFYKTVLPFKPSEARGLTVNQLNTRVDMDEFELGLIRIAQKIYDPKKYLFQEGQYLDQETIKAWLNRKYTKKQLKELDKTEAENVGLNPADTGEGDAKERNEKNPIYLAHILEHNYLLRDKDGNADLKGVVIGLALNSVHYYQKEKFGPTFEAKIDHEKVAAEGKKIAEEVLKRLRNINGLGKVPITIALFEQESEQSVVPGNFFAYAHADEGSSKLGSWQAVKEDYVLFSSPEAEKKHRDDLTSFLNFKQDVEDYFPNFNGVVGEAYYIEDELQRLTIEIPIQFYGKAEVIGFTQYVAGLVMEHFPNYIEIEVNVTSVNGQESLIVRERNEDDPFVHIYH